MTKLDADTKRWIKSEADARAAAAGCRFDPKQGERVVRFFSFLRGTRDEWAGKPFKLLDWQVNDVLMPLFGWRREDGLRRYRKADIFIAKKQGKTTLCAGLVPYFLLADGCKRAAIYGAAFARSQARIMYEEAAAMIQASPAIAGKFKCKDASSRILCPETGSFYQVIAGESEQSEGYIASVVMFDEIHVQKNDKLWKALTYAKSSASQPITLSISTVGVADRTQIWWSRYDYAKRILSGEITDHSSFAYIAQADEKCASDVELAGQEEQWRKANPSLGVTVKLDQFREDYQEARNSPVMFNAFLRYRLNVPTAQDERMIRMDHWDECGGELPKLDGMTCYGGLDVADSDDITALVLAFPPVEQDGKWNLLCKFWCPEDIIQERIDKGFAFYDEWRRSGLLTLTPGKTTEHRQVIADLVEMAGKYDIRQLGYDQWNAGDIANQLEAEGVECIKVSQTMHGLAFGTKRLMEMVARSEINHGKNPVLRWMAANAAGVSDHAGNTRPAKDKSADKIDGIVAAAMALGLGSVHNETEQPRLILC